jgi:signal transduction histidine kinase
MADKTKRTPRATRRPSKRVTRKAVKLQAPSQQAVMRAAFELSRQLSLEVRENELVGVFAQTLTALLPGRHLCIRVVDPKSLELTSLHAEGPLEVAARSAPLALKRSALKRTRLPESLARSPRLRVVDRYERLFATSNGGFSVPLVASQELFGLCNVEYPPPHDLSAVDEPIVIPLANQLSVALRNLNLIGEARYYRDYMRKMLDIAKSLIIVVDRDQHVAVANRAMLEYVGEGAELIGQTLAEVRARSTAPEPRLATLLADGLHGVAYSDCEVQLWRRGMDEMGRVIFSTSVLRAPDGRIDGVIAIGQDVGHLRSLERQVIQAEKLATLGQLAAGVVHELNNPLTSISVYGDYLVKLLERSGDRTEVDKAIKVVEGAARIQKLTRDLMSYARPSGEYEWVAVNEVVRQALVFQKLTRDLMSYARPSGEYEWVAVNEVVRQALVFCEHVVKRAEADVELQLREGLPRVFAIRAQLHQVLINLITNACHSLTTGPQSVRLMTALEEDGSAICVEVADTGVGIGQLDRGRVFDPFFTTKKDGRGTGLGLSIVKNIIEGHGGSITFESRVGIGTTFHVRLPIKGAPGKESGAIKEQRG